MFSPFFDTILSQSHGLYGLSDHLFNLFFTSFISFLFQMSLSIVIAFTASLKLRQLFLVFGKFGVTPHRLHRDSLTLKVQQHV